MFFLEFVPIKHFHVASHPSLPRKAFEFCFSGWSNPEVQMFAVSMCFCCVGNGRWNTLKGGWKWWFFAPVCCDVSGKHTRTPKSPWQPTPMFIFIFHVSVVELFGAPVSVFFPAVTSGRWGFTWPGEVLATCQTFGRRSTWEPPLEEVEGGEILLMMVQKSG